MGYGAKSSVLGERREPADILLMSAFRSFVISKYESFRSLESQYSLMTLFIGDTSAKFF